MEKGFGGMEWMPLQVVDIAQQSGITSKIYLDFGFNMAINLIVIAIMAYGIYFRRHGRRDLLMVFVSFNIGLFIVLSVITLNEASMAVGFGLFAILSLIRLRSEPFSNIELGYFFFAMGFAVVNAMQVGGDVFNLTNQIFVLILNVLGLATLFLIDHPSLQRGAGYAQLVLDRIFEDDRLLEEHLAERLHAHIVGYSITQIDYVRDITTLEVRYIRHGTPSDRSYAGMAVGGASNYDL